MTIQQQIDSAREHLANGNDYSYKALMSAAIRAAISSRSLNQYYKALEDDGFELLDQFNPTADDIVPTDDIVRSEHGVNSELDDDVSDWINRR